ncbi:MAG TPA: hypothetical protein VMV93_02295 [Chloroflexota bacterium]|nr:hypothetical protein [Chloroflexota bacterium]
MSAVPPCTVVVAAGVAPLSEVLRTRLAEAAGQTGKAVVVAPVVDTLKLVEGTQVIKTLNRDTYRWPRAWAYTAACRPECNPPAAEWFVGATAIAESA